MGRLWHQNIFSVPTGSGETRFMRKLWLGVLAGALLCAVALAQDTTAAPSTSATPQTQPSQNSSQPASDSAQPSQQAQPAQTSSAQANTANANRLRIAAGSVIPVQLTKGIDAKKAKTGDEVDARVTQDLKSGNGELIVPKDTKVVGHITEAQARTKDQKESQVAITFDHVVMKDGHDASLPVSSQAIISPQALNANGGNADGGASPSPAQGSAGSSSTNPGRAGSAGTGMTQPRPTNAPATGDDSSGSAGSQPPITANTLGVVGISDMKLSTAGEPNQGSVVSSEKNNVKLENGTLMLLRVNQ
jgi:hypothetical protein